MKKAKKIIFVVTEDWFFCSHRLSIAKAALNAGYKVATITQVKHHKATIESHGIKVIPFKISLFPTLTCRFRIDKIDILCFPLIQSFNRFPPLLANAPL